jgi:hypothetical protein
LGVPKKITFVGFKNLLTKMIMSILLNNIGKLFENVQGVPFDKCKALEWYCKKGDEKYIERLKD